MRSHPLSAGGVVNGIGLVLCDVCAQAAHDRATKCGMADAIIATPENVSSPRTMRRKSWHDFVFISNLADNNLTAKVVDFDGVRVAGLGGVFHADVWHPQNAGGERKLVTRDDYLAAHSRSAWRGGLPLRQTIFPEDFSALAALEADILVTHEAPSAHRYGHSEIDDLAEVPGVKVIVHGHHRQDYRTTLPNGVKVVGLGKASVFLTSLPELIHA